MSARAWLAGLAAAASMSAGAQAQPHTGAVAAAAGVVGRICDEWDFHAHRCAHSVDLNADGATARPVWFVTKMAVDADGSPRAYHPGDVGSYDWLANISLSSLHGIQGQSATGPAPGFYVSGTSLHDGAYPENDTRRWPDAAVIPYFVLPGPAPAPLLGQTPPGTVGFVVDLATGRWSGALYGDSGHAAGEGSIALAKALGLNPISARRPPKVVGFNGKQFLYIVFPGASVGPPWSVDDIGRQATTAFRLWGGEARLKRLYPHCPPLTPTISP